MLQLAVVATLGDAAPAYDLALWHGFNLPLLMSLLALVGGVLLYRVLRRHFDLQQREPCAADPPLQRCHRPTRR